MVHVRRMITVHDIYSFDPDVQVGWKSSPT